MKIDYLIKNGRVINPRTKWDEIRDVGIIGNRIVDIDSTEIEAANVIDATGCIVMPGLIDFHTHIAYKNSEFAINPELMICTGVTAMCDAGTCGYANYESFHNSVIDKSDLRIKSFVNMDPIGIYEFGKHPDFSFNHFNERRLGEIVERYKEELLGFKIMFTDDYIRDMGMNPLYKTIELAEKYGMRVCVHTTKPPCSSADIAKALRAGDIYCHCYQSYNSSILNEEGQIREEVIEARKRGVLFDAANGRMHLSFHVARKAIAAGFIPDFISTDLVSQATFLSNCNKTLPFVMSKYLYLGMNIMDVARAVTENPAKAMGLDGVIGTLESGALADLAIFRLEKRAFHFNTPIESADPEDGEDKALLIPQMTMLNGKMAYCAADFNLI